LQLPGDDLLAMYFRASDQQPFRDTEQ